MDATPYKAPSWMRYRLRKLLIVLAVLPPLSAWTWIEYAKHCKLQQQREALRRLFSVAAGNGLLVVVPAANSASGDPNNERVFSFCIGITR